jgi:hypothetical protein
MKVFMLAVFGIPFVVGVWWLILFNRPRVAAAFQTTVAAPLTSWGADASGFPAPYPAQTALAPVPTSKPSCPIPLLIVSAILLISAFFTPVLFLLPHSSSTPLFLFGFVASQSLAKYFYTIISLLYGALAIGVIRLKPPALDILIAIQVLLLINGILSIFNPGYLHAVQDSMQRNAMANPALPKGFPFLSYSFLRNMMIVGVAFSSAVLGILVGYRDRFRRAASESAA